MHLKFFYFVLFILTYLTTNAQYYDWAKSVDYESLDIAKDQLGNIYTVGHFKGTVDFDPSSSTYNLTSLGYDDIFITKLTAEGNFVWAKRIGGIAIDEANSISIDNNNDLCITGAFRDTVDFDPSSDTSYLFNTGDYSRPNLFIAKLDSDGFFLWAKRFGTYKAEGRAITTDLYNNIYTTGFFQDTIDFDPDTNNTPLISIQGEDVFVSKLDKDGNFIWAKSFVGNSNKRGLCIAVDDNERVYTGGFFEGAIDFDPNSNPSAYSFPTSFTRDLYIAKLEKNGNIAWAKVMRGQFDQEAHGIAIDSDQNVYTTGFFGHTTDFDPGPNTYNLSSGGVTDIFVSKLDSSGNFVWAKNFGGTSWNKGKAIDLDADGNVYTTGFFKKGNSLNSPPADFDPSSNIYPLTSNGLNDIFISKLDPNGNFVWAKNIGGTIDDEGTSLVVDDNGTVYITGNYYGTVDFDPSSAISNLSTPINNRNSFVLKLKFCEPTSSIDSIVACSSYTWIDGNTYTSSNTTATDTLINYAGCDSIITLNLSINTLNATVSLNNTTIISNPGGGSYRWLNCNNNYTMIAGDTAQVFTATTNGNYAVEITKNGCIDTSTCIAITSIAVTHLEENLSSSISIYANNPSSDNIKIELEQNYQQVNVQIYNTLGQIITQNTYKNETLINLNLKGNTGVYFVHIQTNTGEQSTFKVFKE